MRGPKALLCTARLSASWTQWRNSRTTAFGMVAVLIACMREDLPGCPFRFVCLVNSGVYLGSYHSSVCFFRCTENHLSNKLTLFEARLSAVGDGVSIRSVVALNTVGGLRIVTFVKSFAFFPTRTRMRLPACGLLREALPFSRSPLPLAGAGASPSPAALAGFRRLAFPGLSVRANCHCVTISGHPFFCFQRSIGAPRPKWGLRFDLNVMSLEPQRLSDGRPWPAEQSPDIACDSLFLRRNSTIPAGIAARSLRHALFLDACTFQIFSTDANAPAGGVWRCFGTRTICRWAAPRSSASEVCFIHAVGTLRRRC